MWTRIRCAVGWILIVSFFFMQIGPTIHASSRGELMSLNSSLCTSPANFTGAGADVTALQANVDSFRNAIGALNAPQPFNQVGGRREINWDAAPDTVSAPNAFPGNFFNFSAAPRARGAVFTTPGTGFQLSATAASGAGVEFNNINNSYAAQFRVFSAERLLTSVGSNIIDVHFFSPGDQTTPALVDSFGAIFTDVDWANTTELQFYDSTDTRVHTVVAPYMAGQETLSLAGTKFSTPCIYRVRIISGSTALAPGINDDASYDVVALDDFIYGEPMPITLCGQPMAYTASGADAAALQPTVDTFRAALGGLNANAPANLPDGRREINWDAAPDTVSAPNAFPGNFFNFSAAPRARGAVFTTPGTGFQLSATAASGAGVEFNNLNNTYASEFSAFSAERLFTAIGSNRVDTRFFLPADQITPAFVDGFGAVFTDVDLANVTHLAFYDILGQLAFRQAVPAVNSSQASLSFAGLVFDDACVGRVELVNGNAPLSANTNDNPGANVDLVVMDDLIYGEPQMRWLNYLPRMIR